MTKHIHPVYPLSTQKHIIDLARLLSIASDSEMAQAKLKAGSPKAVPLGVFFFFPHGIIPTSPQAVAFTGCFHWLLSLVRRAKCRKKS